MQHVDPPEAPTRLLSIDILRGVATVLMAIDHVRVYAAIPAGGPDPAVFFTRWMTHFCAPVFVFLAGTGAYLSARRGPDLSRFLISRGLWFVLLELTVIRLFWTFNPSLMTEQMAGVIWTIGWSMVLMSGLVRLPTAVVATIGLAVVFGHNLIPAPEGDVVSPLASVLYYGMARGPVEMGDHAVLMVLYSIVPWIGVMACGYAFGAIVVSDAGARARRCLAIGLGSTALFMALRAFNLHGDPNPWTSGAMPSVLSFLNTTKYPASLQFLLMTLGPAIAVIPILDRASGPIARGLEVFGRVPFFFYVLHIPLIHLLAVGVSLLRSGEIVSWLFANHPMNPGPAPEGYRWSLAMLYLVWTITIAILYPVCRWFAGVKVRRRDWWLSYI
jgi:uncharacterized membrane protein